MVKYQEEKENSNFHTRGRIKRKETGPLNGEKAFKR
jgi:hypothetical protein